MRKDTSAMMDSIYKDLLPYVESTEFPTWLMQKVADLGVNGM